MVAANTLRSPRHFVLSAFGIVIGIATFVVFLASTEQVAGVLEKIFPLEQVQVVAPRASILGKDISKKLDDSIVQTILKRPDVSAAVPRMSLVFPAFGRGSFEGNDLKFEVGGFSDGVDPSYVQDDERIKELFKDWMSDEKDPHRIACIPPPPDPDEEVIQSPRAPPKARQTRVPGVPVIDTPEPQKQPSGWDGSLDVSPSPTSSVQARQTSTQTRTPGGSIQLGSAASPAAPAAPPAPAATGSAAGSAAGVGAGSAAAIPIPTAAQLDGAPPGIGAPGTSSGTGAPNDPVQVTGKKGEYLNPCPEPDRYYCDDDTRRCEHRIPIVMSPTMIELYNGQFAKSHGLPIADTDFVKFITQRGGLGAMRFSIGLGQTTIAGSNTAIKHRPRRVEGVLVGISSRAMPIGMTMPIQYIQRWNREFMGEEAATTYSSIIVTLKNRNDIAPFGQWLQDKLDLRLEDSLGEKFATALFVIRFALIGISLVIIGISAINIAHNFFMQVTERRRELGLLRAIGATQHDVRMVVLGEAFLIGLIGGLMGILLGMLMAKGVDYASAHYVPRFPYKPATWFNFRWWIWTGGLVCAAGFAVLGGYLPARRASTMEPAQALTQN
ncbi:MAG TPA: ABC transporter permease [Kofleriaceae bacterium]|nr:ABC transporter permease [Kofleriaceae bacterium]